MGRVWSANRAAVEQSTSLTHQLAGPLDTSKQRGLRLGVVQPQESSQICSGA